MKVFPLSTINASLVERLKRLAATLYHFLDWFTPAHPFIADKRARTFFVSYNTLLRIVLHSLDSIQRPLPELF